MIFRARSFFSPRFLPCFTWLRPAWTYRSSRRPAKAECTRRYLEARKLTRRDRPTESGTARNLSVPTSGVDTTTRRLFPAPIRLRLPPMQHSTLASTPNRNSTPSGGPSPSASSGPGGHSKSSRPSIQPSMYSSGGICSSRISFVTCTASNGRPKTHL